MIHRANADFWNDYRALAVKLPDECVWFWIGEHNVYDVLIK
jgi:hypothetical protein